MLFVLRFYRSAVLAAACVCVAGLLSTARVEVLIGKWQTNARGLETIGMLLGKRTPNPGIPDAILERTCLDYITTIRTMSTAEYQSLPLEKQVPMLQRFAMCWPPERRRMLATWISDPLWGLGRYAEVCDTLVETDAPGKLLELAQHSEDAGNWSAVETSLDCIERFYSSNPWLSPFIVAQLYYSMAQHYEDAGEVDKAMRAYDGAMRWYPMVWANPYTKKARLLWAQGRKQEAIQGLVEGVFRSTDTSATFNLWRELGFLWDEAGSSSQAYCAYVEALHLAGVLPDSIAPESWRADLVERVRATAKLNASEPDCQSLFMAVSKDISPEVENTK